MPRCNGRHSRQKPCNRQATCQTNGIDRCAFHSVERNHFLWFAMLMGCGICCAAVSSTSHMVEFYCCGKFYCYECVMMVFSTSRKNRVKPSCPNCRWVMLYVFTCMLHLIILNIHNLLLFLYVADLISPTKLR